MFWISKIYENVLGTLFAIYASRKEDFFLTFRHITLLDLPSLQKMLWACPHVPNTLDMCSDFCAIL